jgi:putative transcriptional regulator
MKRIAGRLLLASPYLSDPNFYRSVIYMVRHDEEGAFGLLLNRPGQITLDELFSDRLGRPPKRSDPIYFGGPVDGPLIALHTLSGLGDPCGPLSSEESLDGDEDGGSSPVWITADDDQLTVLADRTDVQVRFVVRYSGWGPGQLDRELGQGGWLVGPPDWPAIFGPSDSLWENMVKRVGREILGGILNVPVADDPQWN